MENRNYALGNIIRVRYRVYIYIILSRQKEKYSKSRRDVVAQFSETGMYQKHGIYFVRR